MIVDANRRTLAGYSLGGLLTLQALFKRPGLFRTYVASSPSIWYGDKQRAHDAAGICRSTARTAVTSAAVAERGRI